MHRLLFSLLLAITGAATAQEVGPLYELLDQYRAAQPDTPEAQRVWAEDILRALDANPGEEWATRVRAYEEVGSIYWRNQAYDEAAPIFLGLWDEAADRGDTGLAVTSIDHLINLYQEAGATPTDLLALYDATEDWLRSPNPGQEDEFARLLKELYGERAELLNQYAKDEYFNDAERIRFGSEAAYYASLASGLNIASHKSRNTMAALMQKWALNTTTTSPAGPPAETPTPAEAPAPPAAEKTTPAPAAATTPPPIFPPRPADVPAPSVPVPPAPAEAAGGNWVIPISIAVILVGWGLAAFIYLKRRK